MPPCWRIYCHGSIACKTVLLALFIIIWHMIQHLLKFLYSCIYDYEKAFLYTFTHEHSTSSTHFQMGHKNKPKSHTTTDYENLWSCIERVSKVVINLQRTETFWNLSAVVIQRRIVRFGTHNARSFFSRNTFFLPDSEGSFNLHWHW